MNLLSELWLSILYQIDIIWIKYFIFLNFTTTCSEWFKFSTCAPSSCPWWICILHELLILDRVKRHLLEVVLHDLPIVLGLELLLMLKLVLQGLLLILSLHRRHSVKLMLLLRLYLILDLTPLQLLVLKVHFAICWLLAELGFDLHSIVLTQHLMLKITHRFILFIFIIKIDNNTTY